MPRLTDFVARGIDSPSGERRGLGFLFRCTTGHCDGLNVVLFSNPIDGGPPAAETTWDNQRSLVGIEIGTPECRHLRGCGPTRWKREGETFDTMTLSPSINCHECGHFTVANGGW